MVCALLLALPTDPERPNCVIEVAPAMLGISGASLWMAGLLGLHALLRGRARLLAAPGALLTTVLCAPLLLLAAIAAVDPSAPFGEPAPCGSFSVGANAAPNVLLQVFENTLPTALQEVVMVGQGLAFFVPPLAMLGLILLGGATLWQGTLGRWSGLPLILSLLISGPYLPLVLPERAGFWMANSASGPALWLAPLACGFATLGYLLVTRASSFGAFD